MYFHKNAFKGQVKERAMIYELRTQITFPHISNARRITNLLNDLYGSADIAFAVKFGRNRWANHIFVSVGDSTSIGNIDLTTYTTATYPTDFADRPTCLEILQTVLAELPVGLTIPDLRNWLEQIGINARAEIGIENLLAEMKTGETKEVEIPFTNRYYTSPADLMNGFGLNEEYVRSIRSTATYRDLISTGAVSESNFLDQLTKALTNGKTFEEFVDGLNFADDALVERLKNTSTIDRLHIRYYQGRSQEDTAKAIYRLISVGVIDAYTIDYQNKLYTIHFTKKETDAYFDAFQTLMVRYTSQRAAALEIRQHKQEYQIKAEVGGVTELSFCLEKLTTFIYNKIKEKRIQSIRDMISLCKTAIEIKNDPLAQSELIKDQIYYYFNAKYSREGFIEPKTGEGASLIDDRDANLSIDDVIRKYIRLVNDSEMGQFINNVKHLRGSTMRMIRSYLDVSAYLVLKAYSLLMLSAKSITLLEESKRELVKGLVGWKQYDPTFNPTEFLSYFISEVDRHANVKIAADYFDEIEDAYYTQYYADWTNKLTTEKLSLQ